MGVRVGGAGGRVWGAGAGALGQRNQEVPPLTLQVFSVDPLRVNILNLNDSFLPAVFKFVAWTPGPPSQGDLDPAGTNFWICPCVRGSGSRLPRLHTLSGSHAERG